jgi:hypothetical protein
MRLSETIRISPRYTRSISLERDAEDAAAVAGYILTPIGIDFLKRAHRVLANTPGPRAWTITGPYGSGKSAFVLFLVNLLSGNRMPGSAAAQKMLKSSAPEMASCLLDQRRADSIRPAGFCPILVTGTAGAIAPVLLEAIFRDVPKFTKKTQRIPALLALSDLRRAYARGKGIDLLRLVSLVGELTEQLRRVEKCQGIVVVVDELGKFLEYAAHRPDENDLYLLQLLAEATSAGTSPRLLLITILHQAFDQYAAGLRPVLRNEWAKIQGRFEDVAFQDPPEQLLRVVGGGILQTPSPLVTAYLKQATAIAEKLYDLGCAPPSLSKRQFSEVMASCAPLHPVTALTLARLCRKFGQNQRSLFSFLTSRNTSGLATYLERDIHSDSPRFFSLAELFDYMSDALGNGLSVGEAGSRWAEVMATLDAHRDISSVEAEVVKTVGLLNIVGPYGKLRASIEVLRLALSGQDVRKACDSLQKRSVLVFRRHSSSYMLWQGSDIDLDQRLGEAARRVSPNASLAGRIDSRYSARPLVAKRHSFETGTLRFFRIRFADVATFSKVLERDDEADGVMIYAIPATPSEYDELVRLAIGSDARERGDVLVAVPRNVEALTAGFRELELLRWVEANTPALQADLVARKELRIRLQAAEKVVDAEIAQLFSPAKSSRTAWYHLGIQQKIESPIRLSQMLSEICDEVYDKAPVIKNELLNRRALSSAAAKARRILLEAIITRSNQPRLGIIGYPPELSMYRSLLELNGMHRAADSECLLTAPYSNSTIFPAWHAIEEFFREAELEKHPLDKLFAKLRRAPFGMKSGVIPVLFCVACIVHDTEIAIYESNAFVPEITIDAFERILKSPESFTLRSYRIEGVRKTVFQEYAKLLGADAADSDNLIAVIKPLYRFFNRLQDYTKRTGSLSQKAIAVREALLAARDPDQILFHDLPVACEFHPFESQKMSERSVRTFFHELHGAFAELQRCYDDLLSRLQQLLFQAFDLNGANARSLLQQRAATLAEYAVEPRMRAFIMHLCADELETVAWIEAIGALFAGKPPKSWNDADRARYEVSVAELSRSLKHIEALAFELSRPSVARDAGAEVYRIGITDHHSKEIEAVVSVASADKTKFTNTIMELETALEKGGVAGNAALSLAALAAVTKEFLARLDTPKDAGRGIKALHSHEK